LHFMLVRKRCHYPIQNLMNEDDVTLIFMPSW
jgi:hypothetical protein